MSAAHTRYHISSADGLLITERSKASAFRRAREWATAVNPKITGVQVFDSMALRRCTQKWKFDHDGVATEIEQRIAPEGAAPPCQDEGAPR